MSRLHSLSRLSCLLLMFLITFKGLGTSCLVKRAQNLIIFEIKKGEGNEGVAGFSKVEIGMVWHSMESKLGR